MSMERSLRASATFGDCTKFGGVILGMVAADGAGVGSNGGNDGLLGAVGISSVGGSKLDWGNAGPLS